MSCCEWITHEREKLIDAVATRINQMAIPPNAVVVFDIDETLIDKFNRPVPPLIFLYHLILQRGIGIVLITARKGTAENIARTQRQLRSVGVDGYRLMYFIPVGKLNVGEFKYLSRKNVHEQGYKVIMTIGDQLWDHGAYGGYGFIVPKCFCLDFVNSGHFV